MVLLLKKRLVGLLCNLGLDGSTYDVVEIELDRGGPWACVVIRSRQRWGGHQVGLVDLVF